MLWQAKQEPVILFYSYAHEDEALRQELEKHLSLLRRQGFIRDWHDRQILAGQEWVQEIDAYINIATIILLLVSPDFLASDYCYEREMQQALERHKRNEAYIFPVLLRSCDWHSAPFGHLQCIPRNGRAINEWEHRDIAFTEIATEIRRLIEYSPLPSSTIPPLWNIPYSRNLLFTGREDLLVAIRQHLQVTQPMMLSQPQAMSGLGGVGKTQLAVEYAYRYAGDYGAVLWISADTPETLTTGFIGLAGFLNLPEKEEREQTLILSAVKRWLRSHTSWLLILDNADDLSSLFTHLLPSHTGHILITTRAQAIGRFAKLIEVNSMDLATGTLLLLRRANLLPLGAPLADVSDSDRLLAEEICHQFGGLPLALDQAGAYIEECRCSLAEYLYLCQARRSEILAQRGGIEIQQDHPASVVTTWSLSFAKIEQEDKAAADLLRVCALLHSVAIPEEIFHLGGHHLGSNLARCTGDLLAWNHMLAVVSAYSLLQRNAANQTLSLHRLVQVVLQEALSKQAFKRWVKRIIGALDVVFPDVEPSTWLVCERLIAHSLVCISHTVSWKEADTPLASLLLKSANYLSDRVQYTEAEPLYQRALYIREQALGADHVDVVYPLYGLADLYKKQGRYAEAKPLYQRALHIREQALSSDHPLVAVLINGLALLYREQGQYTKTEALHLRALRIQEQVLGSIHPDIASSLDGLAFVYKEQGRYTEAEALYQRVLHIWKQALGPSHLNVSYPLNGLAHIYREQARYTEAEVFYQHALNIREQVLGPNHPLVSAPLNGLAAIHREQGRYSEGISLYQRAMRIREQALGFDHSSMAYSLNGLAAIYREQGQYPEAEAFYQRALHIWKQALGPHHPDVAYALNGLAHIYREQSRYAECEAFYQDALHILGLTLDPNHPLMAHSLNGLGHLYREQGRYTEAEPLYLSALRIWEQALSSDHPLVAETLYGLSICQIAQGKMNETVSSTLPMHEE